MIPSGAFMIRQRGEDLMNRASGILTMYIVVYRYSHQKILQLEYSAHNVTATAILIIKYEIINSL